MYQVTKNDQWLVKCILPMAISEDNIDEDTFKTVKCSIDNVKIKSGMPAGVRNAAMDEMVEEAKSMGANAVIGIRFASSQVASCMAEILVYGTAVKI